MVPNDIPWPKTWFRNQNQFSRRLRTKVTVSLLEAVLGLLQPLHPVLDLQVGLRHLIMAPNDFPWLKTWGLEAKIKSLEDSEQDLQFYSLKWSLASYSPST